MVFFEPGVDFCLKLADIHGSYQIIKALRLQGPNHSLHARLVLRCPWPCPQLGYILASQPQLGLPLVRLLSKALTPLFDCLLNGLVSARKKKLWRFMTFEIVERQGTSCSSLILPQNVLSPVASGGAILLQCAWDTLFSSSPLLKCCFAFFILTQVLDSGCPICFLESTTTICGASSPSFGK